MALNLRVGFKERHRKRLFEALLYAPLPDKKIYPEAFREEPISDAPTTQVAPSNAARSKQELVMSSFVEKDVCPAENGTPVATPGGDANERDAPSSSLD